MTIKVVRITSISYTGTTWINVLLGCHETAFALGPPDRFYRHFESEPDKLCLVHGGKCELWPAFCASYDRSKPFFSQLASFTGKRIFVINNPVPEGFGRELEEPGLDIVPVFVVRDGRAVAASYARHLGVSFEKAVLEWYAPAIKSLMGAIRQSPFLLRHEDVLESPASRLQPIGNALGIGYAGNVHEYWRWPHHPISGNQGMFAMLKLHQGLELSNFRGREFYESQFQTASAASGGRFEDNRWEQDLTPADRLLFERSCGDENVELGYQRDEIERTQESVPELPHQAPDETQAETGFIGRMGSIVRRAFGPRKA